MLDKIAVNTGLYCRHFDQSGDLLVIQLIGAESLALPHDPVKQRAMRDPSKLEPSFDRKDWASRV
ncbi:hypothetical protein G6L50_14585 [Agrobacterium rubi]|uniref:Uncharacterized protein n=1 Tax=Agrobacterium rubi TaxID=28099 RepID=A0AAE7USF1_9HYPH|nr:hypothetical protein [Agrobacterium rubi]QTG01765.1 hypothetical protein G6M88_14860 [Agrobacterium rubi]